MSTNDLAFPNRVDTIRELSLRNELPFVKVLEIYSRFNSKIYANHLKKGGKFLLYNPELEKRHLN